MVIMTDDYDIERKPAKYTLLLAKQLNEAIKYLREKNPNQAKIMGKQFFKTVRLLERMPRIGTMCQNGMRKFKLGKIPLQHLL
jgi:plasmid stabilization system protein ParE